MWNQIHICSKYFTLHVHADYTHYSIIRFSRRRRTPRKVGTRQRNDKLFWSVASGISGGGEMRNENESFLVSSAVVECCLLLLLWDAIRRNKINARKFSPNLSCLSHLLRIAYSRWKQMYKIRSDDARSLWDFPSSFDESSSPYIVFPSPNIVHPLLRNCWCCSSRLKLLFLQEAMTTTKHDDEHRMKWKLTEWPKFS